MSRSNSCDPIALLGDEGGTVDPAGPPPITTTLLDAESGLCWMFPWDSFLLSPPHEHAAQWRKYNDFKLQYSHNRQIITQL